jgi:hypothetical protein
MALCLRADDMQRSFLLEGVQEAETTIAGELIGGIVQAESLGDGSD